MSRLNQPSFGESGDVDAIVQSFVSDELASLEQAGEKTDTLELSSSLIQPAPIVVPSSAGSRSGPGTGSSLTGPALSGRQPSTSGSASVSSSQPAGSARVNSTTSFGSGTRPSAASQTAAVSRTASQSGSVDVGAAAGDAGAATQTAGDANRKASLGSLGSRVRNFGKRIGKK